MHLGCARPVPAPQQPPATCADTGTVATPGAERRTKTLYAVADLGYAAPDTARVYTRFLLDGLGREFRLPNPAGLAAWSGADSVDKDVAVPALAAEAVVVIRPDGQLDRVVLTQTSLVPAIDAAFASALRNAAESGDMPKPAWLGIDREIMVWVALSTGPGSDLAPPATRPKGSWDSFIMERRTVTHPLMTLQLPVRRFSAHALAVANDGPFPRYPAHLRAARVEGKVTLEFVVGRQGRAVPGTARVLGATDRAFGQAVLEVLDSLTYLPGRIGGCPVAVLVQQSFEFSLR